MLLWLQHLGALNPNEDKTPICFRNFAVEKCREHCLYCNYRVCVRDYRCQCFGITASFGLS